MHQSLGYIGLKVVSTLICEITYQYTVLTESKASRNQSLRAELHKSIHFGRIVSLGMVCGTADDRYKFTHFCNYLLRLVVGKR